MLVPAFSCTISRFPHTFHICTRRTGSVKKKKKQPRKDARTRASACSLIIIETIINIYGLLWVSSLQDRPQGRRTPRSSLWRSITSIFMNSCRSNSADRITAWTLRPWCHSLASFQACLAAALLLSVSRCHICANVFRKKLAALAWVQMEGKC